MAGTRKLHSTLSHSLPVRVAGTAGAEAYPAQQKILQGFSLETLEVQKLKIAGQYQLRKLESQLLMKQCPTTALEKRALLYLALGWVFGTVGVGRREGTGCKSRLFI